MQQPILYIYGCVYKRKYYPYFYANVCLEIILHKTFAFWWGWEGEGSLSKYRKYCYHYLVNSFLYTTLCHQQILSGPDA